jgi:CRISPR-associated endonuclease/helicase Cas3
MHAFLVRMLFSCLVDADFLATEAFMSRGSIDRGVRIGLDTLKTQLEAYMRSLRQNAKPSELNAIRTEILEHVVARANEAPGFFTLTVPTGGGKTLASLSFALAHALRDRENPKRRVIYVIPFTSIIEQTAAIFRDALGQDAVLEHHSNFDWEAVPRRSGGRDGGDARDGFGALRRAAENWDAPIVVTTAVQFFESLFASRTSSCRKLHNIADSVIVLDEAQTLPQPFLLPCLAALDELRRNYGVTVVFCTATQPALRHQDGALRDRAGAWSGHPRYTRTRAAPGRTIRDTEACGGRGVARRHRR